MSDLQRLRKAKGLSRNDLAKILGVTNAAVAQYENGGRNPKDNLLPKYADALGIEAMELTCVFDPPKPSSRFYQPKSPAPSAT